MLTQSRLLIQGQGVTTTSEDDDGNSAKQVGDHIATVYTQIPHNIDEKMKSLASQLLQIEKQIACSSQCGMSSRLAFDKDAPCYDTDQATSSTDSGTGQRFENGKAGESFWKKYF